ncbi:Phosphoglycolate phosphatase [hydrothermal vent metagenome]|uniref:phosphoglycolate phosphatase n=1 Tax=hydrothermal vent metagenome TaxID=652676 RepID=A0A1W1ELK5_9ZZZZ
MKLKNKKLLIFDLDGTLIDSVPDLANAINFTLKKLNRDSFDEDIIRKWVGNGAITLVKRALSGSVDIVDNLDNELFQKAINIFLENYANNLCNDTKIYPNVKSSLEELKKRGYILTIVTNKPYKFIKPILESLDIEYLFEYYIGADTLDVKKPHPKPLLYVCNKFNIDIDNSVMIGDSKNDILAGISANIDTIGVTYGYNYNENISYYNPTIVVDNFEEILLSLEDSNG